MSNFGLAKFGDFLKLNFATCHVSLNDCLSVWQVSDFGLAKFGDFSQTGMKFPIKWTAPEALRENVRVEHNSRCWIKDCFVFD